MKSGSGKLKIAIEPEALAHIARTANGDARAALNALELAAITTPPGADATIHITKKLLPNAASSGAPL